jgi:diacylglycerol kinase family enzyme
MFIGSAGIGFATQMTELLAGRNRPRFCLGWSGLASKAAGAVNLKKMSVRIDAFRFEVHPIIFNVNLLPYSFGLPLTPLSVADDQTAEVVFNFGVDTEPFSTFARQVCKRKYVFGASVKLFRGKEVSIEPVRNTTLCYDGELMDLTGDKVDIKISPTQLKVFC